MRLRDARCDPPLRRQYPFRLTPPQHLLMRDCEVCGGRVAKRVTYDDRATPHSPFFWCEECYGLTHYDAQVGPGAAQQGCGEGRGPGRYKRAAGCVTGRICGAARHLTRLYPSHRAISQGRALYTDFSVFPYTQEYPASLGQGRASRRDREAPADGAA